MSLSWLKRKTRLRTLLKSQGDEDADSLALDRLLHGQSVIGKTSRTTEIESLRFQDKDLEVVGTLAYGQFGVIDVVNCRLNGRVYVRKSIEKQFALRSRDQCFPQFERDILLRALRGGSKWAPHLLCAFHTATHLNMVMDYAEGGTLWDVLESSPYDGKVLEADLKWWTPQIVSAIHWCHLQGFAHRDIKPHNFVLTSSAHVLLVDFGSSAPLLPPQSDGSQLLPRRYCLVPCGTCDYISPEILRAHEEALVALEIDDDDDDDDETSGLSREEEKDGYGLETDWWSLGAMLYEMAYGVAPFFANDIRQTYVKIMNHENSLRFSKSVSISLEYQDLLLGLLSTSERRLGRKNITEITKHPFFTDINWDNLGTDAAPPSLHLPQFTYSEPVAPAGGPPLPLAPSFDESFSRPFAFSALFDSSKLSTPGLSRSTHSRRLRNSSREDGNTSFIGFSWGPALDAFPDLDHSPSISLGTHISPLSLNTHASWRSSPHLTPNAVSTYNGNTATPAFHTYPLATPSRPTLSTPYQTLPRTSAVRRTAPRRAVSDREAMKQLVDCVGMSARKKVLESGRKPRLLTSFSRSAGTLRKELRFLPAPVVVTDYASSSQANAAPVILSSSEDTESEGPPSPSPSPRPGSVMSIISRRSGTPTMTGTFSQRIGSGTISSSSNTMLLNLPPMQGRTFGQSFRHDPSSSSASILQDETLHDLEMRYASIIEDILDMEKRLNGLRRGIHDEG